MNRNSLIPFALIAVIGIAAMFLMSFKGLGDMEEIAAEKENGGAPTEETADEGASAGPESAYSQNCAACHGGNLEGTVGPALKGTALSVEELVEVITNGQGTSMPGGLIPGQEAEMAEWIKSLK